MSKEEAEKAPCKYGAECYQKNPNHQLKYSHPKRLAEDEAGNLPKKSKNGNDNPPDSQPSTVEKNTDSDLECKKIIISNLPESVRHRIKTLFLVDMPDDFYSFFEFCKTLGRKTPKKALSTVCLELVGPFDVLDGNLKDCTEDEALRHYRYFYDPPEFQTVLRGSDRTGLHYGYYRDDPDQPPAFVASSELDKGPALNIVGGNLFSALNQHLESAKKFADPFKKMQIQKIQKALNNWSQSRNVNLDSVTKDIRTRRAQIVAKTFHGAGIVVPFDNTTQVGYRELAMSDDDIKKILKSLCEAKEEDRVTYWDQLEPVITYANIANDEYDFGTSLELGINLFCHGSDLLHKTILQQLTTAYKLLKREPFARIITSHLKNRSRSIPELNTIASD